jgi:hypothetical protein
MFASFAIPYHFLVGAPSFAGNQNLAGEVVLGEWKLLTPPRRIRTWEFGKGTMEIAFMVPFLVVVEPVIGRLVASGP